MTTGTLASQTEHFSADTQPAYSAMFYRLGGQVQGVGFRPFVFRLAQAHHINGWIENRMDHVAIHAEGLTENLHHFQQALIDKAPPAAKPYFLTTQTSELGHFQQFTIRHSSTNSSTINSTNSSINSSTNKADDIHIPADLALCEDCRKELSELDNRRFHYPFINCTQCGPRYTLIRQLPYDRARTTMAEFELCPTCQQEYTTVTDRRFHAEPIACPQCGPQLSYQQGGEEVHNTQQALVGCITDLRQGRIVAIKGIGGYHLVCDARNDATVKLLRARKHRPHKPLAVMLQEPQLDQYMEASTAERQLLCGPIHPIVLLKQKPGNDLSAAITPGLQEIGVLLPYSPLHVLLVEAFDGPLVVTSANLSGEPVLTQRQDVTTRLNTVADAFLHHNRHIQRPADDPVYRYIHHKPRPLRLGRGNAPLALTLPFRLKEPLLAVGGHIKNTIALAWEDRIVISPHIGELDTLRSQQVFEQVIHDLQNLYQIYPQHIACDAHSGYGSSRWAQRRGLETYPIHHHHAHAAAVCGEFPHHDHWLVFCWDGMGLGCDDTLWGGEALLGHSGDWQRVASFKPFHLPGGEQASRQPWRGAAALCWESEFTWHANQPDEDLVYQAWQQKINCPSTSSVGRLFDAAAALTGLITHSSFEAQGPMWLETLASRGKTHTIELPLQQDAHGIWRCDWTPLLVMLTDTNIDIADRARCFHESLAMSLVQQAITIRDISRRPFVVGLSGGVFQNRLLTERVITLLKAHGFQCCLPEQIPINDAGLCYGQVMEFHAQRQLL